MCIHRTLPWEGTINELYQLLCGMLSENSRYVCTKVKALVKWELALLDSTIFEVISSYTFFSAHLCILKLFSPMWSISQCVYMCVSHLEWADCSWYCRGDGIRWDQCSVSEEKIFTNYFIHCKTYLYSGQSTYMAGVISSWKQIINLCK